MISFHGIIPHLLLLTFAKAFTPTCSSTHLPGYEKAYGKCIETSFKYATKAYFFQ